MKLSFININKKDIILWSFFIIYILVITFVSSYHEHWADEMIAYGLAKYSTFGELWSSMREEGHFCLWHILLRIVSYTDLSFHKTLFLVSGSLLSLSAWLILFKSPFSLIGKVFIVFSFPVVYYFSVVSRCYALIPPILFGIAILYKNQHQHKYIYCFLIGLLAHTHAFMEGTVAAFFLLYIYDNILRKDNRLLAFKQEIKPLLLIICLVFMAFIQVSGSLTFAKTEMVQQQMRPIQLFYILKDAYCFNPLNVFLGYEQNGLPLFFRIDFLLQLLATLYCGFLFCKIVRGNFRFLIVIFFTIIWQALFSLYIYPMGLQRPYLLFFVILTIVWTTYRNEVKKTYVRFLITLSIISSFYGYQIIKQDLERDYCGFQRATNALMQKASVDDYIFLNANCYAPICLKVLTFNNLSNTQTFRLGTRRNEFRQNLTEAELSNKLMEIKKSYFLICHQKFDIDKFKTIKVTTIWDGKKKQPIQEWDWWYIYKVGQ